MIINKINTTAMTYTQPNLPYEMDALEPAISARTVDFHYNKHEKAYIDNLNRLIQGSGFEDMELEEVIKHANGEIGRASCRERVSVCFVLWVVGV